MNKHEHQAQKRQQVFFLRRERNREVDTPVIQEVGAFIESKIKGSHFHRVHPHFFQKILREKEITLIEQHFSRPQDKNLLLEFETITDIGHTGTNIYTFDRRRI